MEEGGAAAVRAVRKVYVSCVRCKEQKDDGEQSLVGSVAQNAVEIGTEEGLFFGCHRESGAEGQRGR